MFADLNAAAWRSRTAFTFAKYASIVCRSCALAPPPHPASASASTRTIAAKRRTSLLGAHDRRDAAVAVAEDEFHEPDARREPARPRPAAEWEARLLERRGDDERSERSGGRHDALRREHARRARDAEVREVAARILRRPRRARGGVRRQHRVPAEVHQVERREEVTPPVCRQGLRPELRKAHARRGAR